MEGRPGALSTPPTPTFGKPAFISLSLPRCVVLEASETR
jgi:hypothetical protein